jgi:hypothetical protein
MRVFALFAFLLLVSGCSTAHAASSTSRASQSTKPTPTKALVVKETTRDAPRFAFGGIILLSLLGLLVRRPSRWTAS